MAVEYLVKRTLHVAQCPTCEFRDEKDKNPPREILCPNCRHWIKYELISWTGEDTFR
jgi:hypothetical protein